MMKVLLRRKSLNSLANQQCKIKKRSKRKYCLYDEVMSSRHSPSLQTLKDITFAEDIPLCFLRSLLTIWRSIILSSESLLVTGDFNIHVDVVRDPYRAKFRELIETLGLQQHVIKPTHESGHTLIISRQSENLVKKTPVSDYHIPDHWTVPCLLNLGKPSVTRKTVTLKKTKGVDLAALSNELSSSELSKNPPDTLSVLVDRYNAHFRLLLRVMLHS